MLTLPHLSGQPGFARRLLPTPSSVDAVLCCNISVAAASTNSSHLFSPVGDGQAMYGVYWLAPAPVPKLAK